MKYLFLLTILLCSVLAIQAQSDEGTPASAKPTPVLGLNGSGLRNVPVDNTAEVKFNQISADSGRYFKEGLLHLRDGENSKAREKFDKSVEVFLLSGVNVRASKNLNDCYNQLIETVYRIEFPSTQQPQIKSLSAVCAWNVENKLADDIVAKLTKPTENKTPIKKNVVTPLVGFTEQDFERSPLDDLAKLELTPEEQQIENDPIIKRQYELVKVAVKPKPKLDTKPIQLKDGKVPIVIKYFNENLHDPYTMRFIRWSAIEQGIFGGAPCWKVTVKYRAKNVLGAYVLTEETFFIMNNKVVDVRKV
jgi:hypothetical protein